MPAWTGIGPALSTAVMGGQLRLWGRVEEGALVDATGRVALVGEGLAEGAVGRVEGVLQPDGLHVQRRDLAPGDGRGALGGAADRTPAIAARFALVSRLRRALGDRGYLDVDVAQLLEAPGTDPFIATVPARLSPTWNPAVPDRTLWLHTSPELELKRLLALGFPAVCHVGHVFRQGDLSDQHEPEFLMAEWYRVGWTAAELMAETAAICAELAPDRIGAATERTVAELCRDAAGIDVLDLQLGTALADALGGPPEPFVHAFSRLWVDRVEPALAGAGAVLVTRWPAALGMLARRDPDDPRVALRFELLVDGVELANGFDELCDPVEQRARFQADLDLRRAEGLALPPMPERFLAALAAGLPPCAGVALGVDRLAMVAQGASSLQDLLSSPLRDRVDPGATEPAG